MNLAYPYRFDATGHTAQTDLLTHIRDMIEQILFTSPGERVNRPTFGSGTAQLVFAPNSDVLAAAQQQAIQAGLQQWLSDVIRVQSVNVEAIDATCSPHSRLHGPPDATAADAAVRLRRGTGMIYFCSQKNRRALVLQKHGLNGIDFLEVVGSAGCGKQLAVTLLKDARQLALSPDNIAITGGAPVNTVSISPATDDDPFVLVLNLDATGDFSPYTLAIVVAQNIADPPDGFDPQLSSVEFSFKAGCPSPADCLPDKCCPGPPQTQPDINYLAKDYEGFRQVMLDRLAVTCARWTETHVADLGIALVETLAYTADHLSYQQDAVSTEAYLGTARSRISLRRHARLVDYQIGEGSNARTWVYLNAASDGITVPTCSLFYVRVPGLPSVAKYGDAVAQQLARGAQPVFASMQNVTLYQDHNSMDFYTWGDTDCCLDPGACEATLAGSHTALQPGDVLVFEEVLGPDTGDAADANPENRWAVCLISVSYTDYQNRLLVDPLNGEPITQITWAADDALPFPLCISSTSDVEHGSVAVHGVSVARGNIVPADHGVCDQLRAARRSAGRPALSRLQRRAAAAVRQATVSRPFRAFYPELANSPLTFSAPFTGITSANSLHASEPRQRDAADLAQQR